MSLEQGISEDFKIALKAQDGLRVSILRVLRTALKNKQVELRRPLEDEDVVRVITTLVKQARDSIEQYRNGGRNDLTDKEQAESVVLESYLPQQLSDEELKAVILQVVSETGAAGMKDMGKVMKAAMPKVAGKADGKKVNEMVKSLLSA